MEALEPTSWLLSGAAGWRSAHREGTVAGERGGLRLAFDPGGPQALAAADESLGGLGLPRGVAASADGALYLLGRGEDPWIKCFDPARRRFRALPLAGRGLGPAQLFEPRQIACVGRHLYVADTGNRRVQAFDRATLGLRRLWQLADREGPAPVAAAGPHLFVRDPAALARRLGHGLDPLSIYLAERLPAALRERVERFALDRASAAERDEPTLGKELGAALDSIAASPGALYSPARFRKVRLDAETAALVGAELEAAELIRLHLRLLEAAYPALVSAGLWQPVDLAARGDALYVLDGRYGRVFRQGPGADEPRLVAAMPGYAGRLSRLLVAPGGELYLLDGAAGRLLAWQPGARGGPGALAEVDPDEVRDRLAAPAIRLDHRRRLCVPASLARPCPRGAAAAPPPARPLEGCAAPSEPPPAVGDALLDQQDIADLAALAAWLKGRGSAAARTVYGQLSAESLRWLAGPAARPAPAARSALLDDLNGILQGRPLACEPGFDALALRPALRRRAEQRPHGAALVLLNRLLLEAACPAAFAPRAEQAAQPLTFDLEGARVTVAPDEAPGPYVYARAGRWYSQALDSGLAGCQWHRIELELLDLPQGTQVRVSSFSFPDPGQLGPPIQELPASLWEPCAAIAPQPGPPGPLPPEQLRHEFLVQSPAGQYLWLKVDLVGDGYATPAVGSLRVHYPRQSYLRHLPAVFSADDESRWFLERFLAAFQTEWDALERTVGRIEAFFDPRAAPAEAPSDFVSYLARWLALPLEGAWGAEQKRRLLLAAPRILSRRGTAESLAEHLRVYLWNIAGLPAAEQLGFPLIVEGFRERRRAMLTPDGGAEVGPGAPLWGAGQVGRLQLDRFSREGEVRLVATGDPERDLFHEYAHRFRLFVPGAWVRTAADERMLRRAVEAERPSHTRYDLILLEPRLRVGVQSTVGIDTLVGGYPATRLAHRFDDGAAGRRPDELLPAPSAAPRSRLGYDTILGRRPAPGAGLRLGAPPRVGVETLIT